jgi:hypothetical protein
VDGSVYAKDQQLSGHLIVSGKDISWRNTPIQELHGAIRLAGKEIQIASLELLNRDDYLHGQGVVNLNGDYRGDFRASVEDFSRYASVLQNPLWPTPVAGGAVLRWTGEGTNAKGHTGRFFARLQKLRPAQAEGAQSHPVDAELEGSYEPGKTIFSRLNLADEECSLSTKLELTAKSLQVTDLRLLHGEQTWLQGNALLPREFFRNWMEPLPPAPPGPGAPLKLSLKATGLSLKHAVRLTGWNWPVEGFVDGELSGQGTLGQLALSGQCTLVNGHIPIGWNGDALDAVRGELHAAGQKLSFINGSAVHRTGKYSGNFELDLTQYRDPLLTGSTHCDRAIFPLFERLPASPLQPSSAPIWCEAASDLQIAGPLTAAVVKGDVRPFRFRLTEIPSIAFLWDKGATPPAQAPFTAAIAPFYRWRLQIAIEPPAPIPVAPGPGTILPKLELRGTGRAPELLGSVQLENIPARGGAMPLTVKTASLSFRPGQAKDPMIDLHAVGVIEHFPFNAYVLGPLSRHMAFADSKEALARFAPEASAAAQSTAPLKDLEQPGWLRGASALPWAPIILPPASANSQPASPAPGAPAAKAE